jgi:drug/metabolite transporter (DMT)-like permease
VNSSSGADYLKLHFIVLLWGLTGVLGEIIDLPAVELVLYRTSIATIALAFILRQRLWIDRVDILRLMATGFLIGLHWVLFFFAVKIANVSVCMVGVATVSLWTALLEPVMIPGRKMQRDDLLFGTLVIGAVALIFQSELQYASGFLVAIGAAFVGAIFSILNGRFAARIPHRVIAAYEMAGAAIFCAICLPISARWLSEGRGLDLVPGLRDWAAIVVLALLCTVYAYSEYVELLKRMTVFSINFANNLEPVYGLALAAIAFGEYRSLGIGFYAGAALIAVLVLAHTRRSRRKRIPVG